MCKEDNPDCFNCPYPDCIATQKDITRQNGVQRGIELNERNNIIVDAFLAGADIDGLAERFDVTDAAIRYVLKEAGIDYKKEQRKRSHGRVKNINSRLVW